MGLSKPNLSGFEFVRILGFKQSRNMAQHTVAQIERRLKAVDGNSQLADSLNFEAMALIAELGQAAAAVRNRIEQGPLSASNLSYTGYQVMLIVATWQPIETREIAAEAGLGKAALSGVLATLERRKLISRSKSRDDARLVRVSLTPAGKELFDELLPQVNQLEAELTEQIHPNNRALLIDLLRKLAAGD